MRANILWVKDNTVKETKSKANAMRNIFHNINIVYYYNVWHPYLCFYKKTYYFLYVGPSHYFLVFQNNFFMKVFKINKPQDISRESLLERANCTTMKDRWNKLTYSCVVNKCNHALPTSITVLQNVLYPSPNNPLFNSIQTTVFDHDPSIKSKLLDAYQALVQQITPHSHH